MTVDGEAISRAAYKLAHQLDNLEQAKTQKPKPSDTRIMAPTFGPGTPGNGHAIDTDWEVWIELRSWCVNLNATIQSSSLPPFGAATADYARWAGMTGSQIATDPDAEMFLEEMMRWTEAVEQVTGPAGREPTQEPWQLAPVIIQMVDKLGATITRRNLAELSSHGYIDAQKRMTKNGWRNTYRLSQVLKHLDNGRSSSTYWRTSTPVL